MGSKKSKPSYGDPSEVLPIAIPPKAPPEVRLLIEKLLSVLEDVHMPSLTEAQHHDLKALAHFVVAAFHISHMPDNQYRQVIVERAVPLIEALVRDNEAARKGRGTVGTIRPGETKH